MIPTMLIERLGHARQCAMGKTLSSAAAAMLLAGCIQVTAPDKPIEINLNVNIRQEVVVSLRDDVKNLDQQYPGVF
ncbi:MAG: YnbE family lipoprotein [Sphingomonas bacterium]|jgi:hypothetical protein|nr:YnbE family lipoprotein [Sphingomonas bacterium]MDB5684032.1 YnbE family lipoprotein [Sphingomonas bacterium]MDB5719248.1 YnbE family lipoprotein [Sphingomonas bacterium]